MDKGYWEEYYKSVGGVFMPSPFAQFVTKEYLKPEQKIAELGCGNGRDSLFFAKNGLIVHAVDQCEDEIQTLKLKIQDENIEFIADDFTNLKNDYTFDAVYSRFTLHSVSEEEEDRTLDWSYNQLNKQGAFLIEARGQKNELFGLGEAVPNQSNAYIHENHYRRFINFETILDKLKARGFKISYAAEDKGFSPYEDTDYVFIRIVAHKI